MAHMWIWGWFLMGPGARSKAQISGTKCCLQYCVCGSTALRLFIVPPPFSWRVLITRKSGFSPQTCWRPLFYCLWIRKLSTKQEMSNVKSVIWNIFRLSWCPPDTRNVKRDKVEHFIHVSVRVWNQSQISIKMFEYMALAFKCIVYSRLLCKRFNIIPCVKKLSYEICLKFGWHFNIVSS